MIIYTDQVANMFGTELTPAHTYAMISDFSKILDAISRCDIPTGTGEPFPVNWKTEEDDANRPPWLSNTNYISNPGFINPYA